MKRGIHIYLSNKIAYTLMVILIIAIVGVGVYAFGTSTPSTFGHSLGEIEKCTGNKILKMNSEGTAWTCGDDAGLISESDPKVGTLTNNKWCKTDGSKVVCTTNAPVTSETDPQVGTMGTENIISFGNKYHGGICTTDSGNSL